VYCIPLKQLKEMEMLKVIRAKLHGIRVTSADLDYHGSITLDPLHCEEAGIRPLEYVDVFNKENGARWYTYVIFGEPGSKCCVLNGPSARNCQTGDTVIVCASTFIQEKELYDIKPKVLTFSASNEVEDVLHYDVSKTSTAEFSFNMVIDKQRSGLSRSGPVDVAAVTTDLRKHGLSDHAIADIIARHLKSVAA
jgi:aspartate 1-decarboxylase